MRFVIFGTSVTLGEVENGKKYVTATVQEPGQQPRFVKLDEEPMHIGTAISVYEGMTGKRLTSTDKRIVMEDNFIDSRTLRRRVLPVTAILALLVAFLLAAACTSPNPWVQMDGDVVETDGGLETDGEADSIGGADMGVDYGCDSPVTYYPDLDGDGYGDDSQAVTKCGDAPAGYITTGGDCADGDERANPGQGGWFDEPIKGLAKLRFDFNCDGKEEQQEIKFTTCTFPSCSGEAGAIVAGSNVQCGKEATFLKSCKYPVGTPNPKECLVQVEQRNLFCR
jgi:hypothetical protein